MWYCKCKAALINKIKWNKGYFVIGGNQFKSCLGVNIGHFFKGYLVQNLVQFWGKMFCNTIGSIFWLILESF